MKVRTKMISVLALLFSVMVFAEIAIQKLVLMPSFAELERDNARTSIKRVEFALGAALDNLELTAADWGNWADVYQFAATRQNDFVAANITPAALRQLGVNALMIADGNGEIIAARALDLENGGPLELDLTAARTLPRDFPWRADLPGGGPLKGLLRTDRGIMLLAAAPVRDGSGGGPSRGMVLMGKLLNARELRLLADQAQTAFSMSPALGARGADRMVESDDMMRIQRPFFDLYGRPLMSLALDQPRRITDRGRDAVASASLCLLITGAAALLLLVVVLNRVVLTPLGRVTRHAVSIGEGDDLTRRLDLPGDDEVAVLAREFDRMVERVAQSRRELVDQSFQSGFAELAKGVLHNLGNAMTPLGVRLATLGERLRDAPLADVEFAADELAREPSGTQRRADLEEFVRLGCRELATTFKDAQADLMVIQRQSAIVQTALAELMRSTHNEHVKESVRLPDLVLQTLEIVPDACRQRLVVEADDSLRGVGVVQVARTVLRLVLQNLIINAADAVREAGRDKGVFRLAAEIIHEDDRERLHLRCVDDGVGIAAQNLERVFDKGFSTKSRDTNHGIGLHWCANAVAALGGRIWATSDGPGLGASMHLILPLS